MAGGLFFKQRAIDFFNHINREVIKEVIESPVLLYRISPYDVQANIYGESDSKPYLPAIQLHGLVRVGARETETNEFGPDSTQTLDILFNREMLQLLNNVVPQVGDIIEWNSLYYEIHNVNESKFVGGQVNWNFALLCAAHLTRKTFTLLDDTHFGSNV